MAPSCPGRKGSDDPQSALRSTDPVRISGLSARPELNGLTGQLKKWLPEKQRWGVEVQVDSPDGPIGKPKVEVLAVRPTNLERVPDLRVSAADGDYATLQAAIDSPEATFGVRIVVSRSNDGRPDQEDVTVSKAVQIQSADGGEENVVVGSVKVKTSAGTTRLHSLHVAGGVEMLDEGALEIEACTITNSADATGVMIRDGRVLLKDCRVDGCSDGVLCQKGDLVVEKCVIEGCVDDGIFSNPSFVVRDTIIRNVGRHGIKCRGGVIREGNNNRIQASPWDDFSGYSAFGGAGVGGGGGGPTGMRDILDAMMGMGGGRGGGGARTGEDHREGDVRGGKKKNGKKNEGKNKTHSSSSSGAGGTNGSGGVGGVLWDGATSANPTRAYHVIIDACRLQVEDAYVMQGDLIGAYAEAAGEGVGCARRYFSRFLDRAVNLGLLPDWWSDAHSAAVKQVADDESSGFCVRHAVEKHDIVETWGNPMMLLALRSFNQAVGEDESSYGDDYVDDCDVYDDELDDGMNTLVVSGMGPLGGGEDDFYTRGLLRYMREKGFPGIQECVIQGGTTFTTATALLKNAPNRDAVILVGLGSGGDDADCLTNREWREVLHRYVEGGGNLIMQGEGKSVETVAGWFELGWHFAGDCYRRTDFEFNSKWIENNKRFEGAYDELVRPYNVKTVMLSGVREEHRVFRVAAEAKTSSPVPFMAGVAVDDAMCPVAMAPYGAGHVGFVGDVNAEDATFEIISILAAVPPDFE